MTSPAVGQNLIASGIAALTRGREGDAVTAAVLAAGMARNRNALAAYHDRNRAVINGYFALLDVERVASAALAPDDDSASPAALLLAAGAGALACYFLTR